VIGAFFGQCGDRFTGAVPQRPRHGPPTAAAGGTDALRPPAESRNGGRGRSRPAAARWRSRRPGCSANRGGVPVHRGDFAL